MSSTADVFAQADELHFDWVTRCPYVADQERALLRAAFNPLGSRIVDVGCGQGAGLFLLQPPGEAIGVDRSAAKIEFARRHVDGPRFEVADAANLPFEAASFDHLLVRDLIHHLEAPADFVREAARVLEPAGHIDVLEPCGLNPLIAMHALTTPSERAELSSRVGGLRRLLEPHFQVIRVEHFQALPLHRVVFHPRLGAPKLAHSTLGRTLVSACERAAARLLPRSAWAYIHLRAVRPG